MIKMSKALNDKLEAAAAKAEAELHTDDTDRALLDDICGRWVDRNKGGLTVLFIQDAEAGDGSLATLLADVVEENGGEFPGDFDELASKLDNNTLAEMAHAATCELLDRSLGE